MNDFHWNHRHRFYLLILRGLFLALFSALAAWLAVKAPHQVSESALAMLLGGWAVASLPLLPARASDGRNSPLPHLLLDAMALSALLYFTGGYANPLVSLYLFPVLIAGLTLPPHRAWIVGGLVIAGYSWLIPFHRPLPVLHESTQGFHLHLLGMWLTFVMTVIMLLTVVVRMSEERRRREAQMSTLRQGAIRDRNMLALGAQAASDAHELGTPINSLMLLLDQWRPDELDNDARARISHMREQLMHCRDVLARLSRRANALCAPHAAALSAEEMLGNAVHQWCNLHPDLCVHTEIRGETSHAAPDTLLEQAVFILLDNAVEAGANHAWVRLEGSEAILRLTVEDDGPGFDASLLRHAAASPMSTRGSGKGLGLYLLRYLTEYIHGSFILGNRENGGARIQLEYPREETICAH